MEIKSETILTEANVHIYDDMVGQQLSSSACLY